MSDTLDAALEALRRQTFYQQMCDAQDALRSDAELWSQYTSERDAWLNADLAAT